MATVTRKITFANGTEVRLSKGEISALERFIRMNGSNPDAPQYDPGHVKYTTVENLVRKGVFRRGSMRMPYLVEGLIAPQGPSLCSATPFSL